MNNESFGEWAKTIKTLFQGYADLIHIATCKLYVVIWYNSWDALSSLVVKKFSVDLVVIEISSQSFKPMVSSKRNWIIQVFMLKIKFP